MDKKTNEILLKNVVQLSKLTEQEVKMMPAIEAPLPSVEQVKQIVTLVKSIIFPDYFNKRQPDETVRSYYIGVHMEELYGLLVKQIAHGLQFCEDCEEITTKRLRDSPLCLSMSYRKSNGCSIPMYRRCSTTTLPPLTTGR